jgi:hypothetical protein
MEESLLTPDPRSDSPTKRIHLRAEQGAEELLTPEIHIPTEQAPEPDLVLPPTMSGFQRPTTVLEYLSRQFGP